MVHSLVVAGGNAGGWWLVICRVSAFFLQLQSLDISTVIGGVAHVMQRTFPKKRAR
jgi:hypothetical protein